MSFAIPDTPDGMEEVLNSSEKIHELMGDPDSFKEFLRTYAKMTFKRDPELTEQLRTSVERTTQNFLQDNGYQALNGVGAEKRPNMGEEAVATSIGEPSAPGAALNGKFPRLADFYKAIDWQTRAMGGLDNRLMGDGVETRVLNETQGDQGGFLVPEEFRAELLQLAIEEAVVRPRAVTIPMTTLSIRMPAIRDTTHASTVFGGIQAYWTPESGSFTQTEPTFSQVKLEAKKLMGGTRTANELIRDSIISLEAILGTLLPQAVAYFEDDAFIAGIGGGQPLGILNADALVTVSKEGGQAATSIVWENLVKMYSRMLPSSLSNAVWLVHQDTFPQLATMSLNVGTGGSAIWLNNGVSGPPATILGRPVIVTEKCETLGTAGDIYFADFSYYLIGDRQSFELASSQHVRFNTDETDWRFIERVDGRPWVDSALTPRNGSNTVTPFVNLATRS